MTDIAVQLQATDNRRTGTTSGSVFSQVNSNNAFTIKVRSISFGVGMGIDESPYIGGTASNFPISEVHVASTTNPVIYLRGYLNIKDSDDRSALGYLISLAKHKGQINLLTTDNAINRTMLRFIAEGTTTATIVTRLKDLKISQGAGSATEVSWSLTLVQTA